MPLKRHKKKIKVSFFIIAIISLIAVSGFAYYLISNEAPALYGKVQYNIPYNANQTLDIYLPTQNVYEQTPVVVYIHGGAWIGGYKEVMNADRFNGAINSLRASGYAVVSINYTLAKKDQPPFPACIIDAFDALKWVENNQSNYGFDLENVGLLGESAGSHIAMMAAFTEPKQFDLEYEPIKLQYIVNVYGPNDLWKLYEMESVDSLKKVLAKLPENWKNRLDITQYLFGFDPEKEPERANELMNTYSPSMHLSDQIPPMLLIHGDKDQIVPVEQSEALKFRLDSMQIENEYHILTNVDHAFRGATAQQKEQVQEWISGFIIGHYRNP